MLKTVAGILLQAAAQHDPDVCRGLLWQNLPIGLAFENTSHSIGCGLALKGKPTRQHLVHDAAE